MFLSGKYVYWTALISSVLLAYSPAAGQGLSTEPLPKSWQQESALRDIHLIDARQGWAVGDHGVILKTTDGGQRWNAVADVNRAVEDWNQALGQLSLREKLNGVKDRRVQAAVATSKLSSSKVTCQLNSVYFLNESYGWAAGGYAVPLLDRTRSVVLKTVDGGVNWQVITNTTPPHIKHLHFSDHNTGWAIGNSSSSFGSGIFFTHDGGQTWQGQSLADRKQRHDWVAAARQGQRLIGVSATGQLKFSQGNKVDNGGVLADRRQHFADIVVTSPGDGWAVGALGAIFQTRDQGLSWQSPRAIQANRLSLGQIDFQTVTATETKVWAAGKPGGCLVSVDKQSSAVKIHATPITSAIHQIVFVDEAHGWAVGDLGMIIATTDGGQTWQIQRGNQTRVGLMSVCFDVAELPLELLAQYACEDDILCSTVGIAHVDTHSHQAASRCGNAVFGRLNLPDVRDAKRQQAAVIRRLVTEIRTQRPSCIVLNPSMKQSIAATLDREKLLTMAVHSAADSNFEPDRYDAIHLKPWQVDRMAIADVAGSMSVSGEKFLPNLSASISDRIFTSKALLGPRRLPTKPLSYRVVRFLGRGAGGQSTTAVPLDSDLMTGLLAVPRRAATEHPPGNLSMIGRRNQKRETFKRILKTDINEPDSVFAWQNEMLSLMVAADRSTAGNWLIELADDCFEADKPELAAKTMDFLVQRMPEHAFTPASLLWLAAFHSSEEYSRRAYSKIRVKTLPNIRPVAAAVDSGDQLVTELQVSNEANGDQQLQWAVPDKDLLTRKIKNQRRIRLSDDDVVYSASEKKLFELGDALAGKPKHSTAATAVPAVAKIAETAPSEIRQASAIEPIDSIDAPAAKIPWSQFIAGRRQLAAKYLARLRGGDPDLALSDQTIGVELALLRNSDQPTQSIERLQQLLKESPTLGPRIQREIQWLEGVGNSIAGDDVVCLKTEKRPVLDGKFDDDVWRSAFEKKTFQQMENSDVVFFGHDSEFLFFIARINKRPDYNYSHTKKRRVRDANLLNRDRIEIGLDCDRDGRTKFQLTIDHRGWVNESFDVLSDWDPNWYVSQTEDEDSWTVEAAVPLAALRFESEAESGQSAKEAIKPWSIDLRRRISTEDFWNGGSVGGNDRSMLSLIDASFGQRLFKFHD
jgi:photosystem II stability/assembly factor-like uncharacterized protein